MGLEHVRLVNLIRKLTGVHLEDEKLYLLDSRLRSIMHDYEIPSYDALARILENQENQDITQAVIDKITTHETRFFRDESIFDGIVLQIIPEWLKHQGVVLPTTYENALSPTSLGLNSKPFHLPSNLRLNIWSAACSTGQEPYSVSMILREKQPRVAEQTSILATDISHESVKRARAGAYTKFEIGRGLPDYYRHRYFKKNSDDAYQINDDIRNMVNFKTHNLIAEPYPGKFDIILCRNISIYFTEEQKKTLFEKLRSALKKDGVLILGSAESVAGYLDNFIIREFGLARYYELNSSQVYMF